VPINNADANQNPGLGTAPFGYEDNASASRPRKVTLVGITDGTSNTLLMSEIIMAGSDTDFDIRGDFLNDDRPCTQFMTINTPNSGTDVTPYCLNNGRNPPCTTSGSQFSHKAARSKHTGGVNVLMGDGSVRFMRSAITLQAWRAYGTMNGGEAIVDN